MPYAIIADWDGSNKVTRYNFVDREIEAIAIVNRLRGVGPNPLPPAKQAPNAYYVLMPPAPAGTALFQHRARFWIANPTSSTVSFDTTACHGWQSKITRRVIDVEADKRVDKVFSPSDRTRAGRTELELLQRRSELQDIGRLNWTVAQIAEWDAVTDLLNRARGLRAAAQTLKNSLTTKTPEGVLAVDPSDNRSWPE